MQRNFSAFPRKGPTSSASSSNLQKRSNSPIGPNRSKSQPIASSLKFSSQRAGVTTAKKYSRVPQPSFGAKAFLEGLKLPSANDMLLVALQAGHTRCPRGMHLREILDIVRSVYSFHESDPYNNTLRRALDILVAKGSVSKSFGVRKEEATYRLTQPDKEKQEPFLVMRGTGIKATAQTQQQRIPLGQCLPDARSLQTRVARKSISEIQAIKGGARGINKFQPKYPLRSSSNSHCYNSVSAPILSQSFAQRANAKDDLKPANYIPNSPVSTSCYFEEREEYEFLANQRAERDEFLANQRQSHSILSIEKHDDILCKKIQFDDIEEKEEDFTSPELYENEEEIGLFSRGYNENGAGDESRNFYTATDVEREDEFSASEREEEEFCAERIGINEQELKRNYKTTCEIPDSDVEYEERDNYLSKKFEQSLFVSKPLLNKMSEESSDEDEVKKINEGVGGSSNEVRISSGASDSSEPEEDFTPMKENDFEGLYDNNEIMCET